MKLRSDWRLILRRAWSVRLMFLAAALTGLATVWFALADRVPIGLFIVGGMVVPMMALGARLMAQKGLDDDPPAAP